MIHSARELKFEGHHFRTISELVRRHSGIDLPERKKNLVYSRLSKRVRQLDLKDFDEYCRLLEQGQAVELEHLISSLTTNVTRFFREAHHFSYFEKEMLPNLSKRAAAGDTIRLWSAGCSTGEEAYSLALTIRSKCGARLSEQFRILATDIDPVVLSVAMTGNYHSDSFGDIPDRHTRAQLIQRIGDQVVTTTELQEMISFRVLNLVGDWPIRGPFDLIMCRNVAIYFDKATQARLWSRFHDVLSSDGALMIGHSERITGQAAAEFENVAITTYRKRLFVSSAPVHHEGASKCR